MTKGRTAKEKSAQVNRIALIAAFVMLVLGQVLLGFQVTRAIQTDEEIGCASLYASAMTAGIVVLEHEIATPEIRSDFDVLVTEFERLCGGETFETFDSFVGNN